jgi:hypothetical protein
MVDFLRAVWDNGNVFSRLVMLFVVPFTAVFLLLFMSFFIYAAFNAPGFAIGMGLIISIPFWVWVAAEGVYER